MLAMAAVAGAVIVLAICLSEPARTRKTVAFGVGATAAFDQLQIHRIHVFTLMCLLLLATVARDRAALKRAMPILLVGVSAALLAASVPYGSLVNDRSLAVQLLLLAGSACLLIGVLQPEDLPVLAYGFLSTVVVAGLVAILQLASVIPQNYFVEPIGGLLRVRSIYREPDFMALYMAVGIVLALHVIRARRVQMIALAALAVPLVMSFARGSWVALGATLGIAHVVRMLAGHDRDEMTRDADRRRTQFVVASLVGVTLLLAVDAHFRSVAGSRVLGALGQGHADLNVQARSGQLASLGRLAAQAPWHGYGLSAAGRVVDLGTVEYGRATNNVATNWLMDWWVDGKYLAVPLILLFVVTALLAVRTVYGQALTLILINSLFSNVMFAPIAWFALATSWIAILLRNHGTQGAAFAVADRRTPFGRASNESIT